MHPLPRIGPGRPPSSLQTQSGTRRTEELVASLSGFKATGLYALEKCVPRLYGDIKCHPCGSTILSFLPHRDHICLRRMECPLRGLVAQVSDMLASEFLVDRINVKAEQSPGTLRHLMMDGEVRISASGMQIWFLLHDARMNVRIRNNTGIIRDLGYVRIRCACNRASHDRCKPGWSHNGWLCPRMGPTLHQSGMAPGFVQSNTRELVGSSWPLGWVIQQALDDAFSECIVGLTQGTYHEGLRSEREFPYRPIVGAHPIVNNHHTGSPDPWKKQAHGPASPKYEIKEFDAYSWVCSKLSMINLSCCCYIATAFMFHVCMRDDFGVFQLILVAP